VTQTFGDLAHAKRGVIGLAKVVRSPVPRLNLRGVSASTLRQGQLPAFPR